MAHSPIPLSRPDITEMEIEAVNHVLSTPYLSLGPELGNFEQALQTYCQTPYAIATSSGTAALHLCLRSLNLKPGDEVITTPFSFIASSNVLLFEHLVPVFVDIDPSSLNLDPKRVEQAITPKTKAILVVHAFGNPANMSALMDLAKKYNLRVIEDACEAIGSKWNGQNVGTFGDLGTLAFYPNKQMTTGEGGAVLTAKKELAETISCMRNQGRKPTGHWLDMEELGYNYRLSEMNCALGKTQVVRLPEILHKRTAVATRYDQMLGDDPNICLPPRTHHPADMSWFVYVVRLAPHFRLEHRESVFQKMAEAHIACGRYFAPIHLQPYYRRRFGYQRGMFPITEAAGDLGLALPFFNHLSQSQAERVCENLKAAIKEL